MSLSVVCDRLRFHKRMVIAMSCLMAVWVSAVPASAATISVISSSDEVVTGETFYVDFIVDGVTDLNAFVFGFYFDESILALNSVSEGTFLSGGGETTFQAGFYDILDPTDPLAAVLFNSVSLLDPLTGVSGSGLLLRVSFTAIAEGTSAISAVFDSILADGLYDTTSPFADNLIAFGEDGLYVSSGSVTVSAPPTNVPEPGTLLLLSTGLATSIVASRRRRRPAPHR